MTQLTPDIDQNDIDQARMIAASSYEYGTQLSNQMSGDQADALADGLLSGHTVARKAHA